MEKRVTIFDLAERAGVSKSTVSRALADDPRCARGTRERVQALAREMGYVPDPALSALVAHRDGRRVLHADYNLAVVTNGGLQKNSPYKSAIWAGVQARAAVFGYAVEFFDCEQIEPERLGKLLQARGVRGVIWGWLLDARYLTEFPWERFAHVGFLLPVVRPDIHKVRDDSFRTVLVAVEAALARGFRRPLLALATSPGSENDRLQRAGWLLAHAEAGLEPLPIWRSTEEVSLAEMVRTTGADIVIGNVDGVYWQLQAGGLRVPGDVAYLNLLHAEAGRFAGFDCGEREIGIALVETVDRLVRHNQLGLVAEPTTILVKRHFAGWAEG